MEVNFRMLTGITVIWMLQAEIPVCVFGVGLPVFVHFLKIGSFKKKEIINIPQMLSSGWLVNASGAADKHRQKTW